MALGACRVLGALDALLGSIDPYESNLGRARADWLLSQRMGNER